MKTTKLLILIGVLFIIHNVSIFAQCSLIRSSGSSQDPNSVCAPVKFTMNVWYKFLIPLTPAEISQIQIEFVWNDAGNTITFVPGNWNTNLDSVWAEESLLYPPDDECALTAEAYLVINGTRCTSSSYQEQTFSTWGTDEENSGDLEINPVIAEVCEGDSVNVTFQDNSTFNCNITIEPDNPNEYYRWVQFVYNTNTMAGDRIPEVTVTDSIGTPYLLTDGTGASLGQLYGPIVRIPIPANGPNQLSYTITAPPNGVAGNIFEITLRNWNICNPYDLFPGDGLLPTDSVNGDSLPILTTARVEIIAPPPVVTNSLVEHCTGENILLTATAGGADITWYDDSLLTSVVHTGPNFDPTQAPYNLNNTIADTHNFYVTSTMGACQSGATEVELIIYQSPLSVFAGLDQTICADTITLNANAPVIGNGLWTTTTGATIINDTLYNTLVNNLSPGVNIFTWEVTNGPCALSDDVAITSDLQPNPAFAGVDTTYCHLDSIQLFANTPNNNGLGQWVILSGGATVSETNNPNAILTNPAHGNNVLMWRISSEFGSCPVTTDTIDLFADLHPGNAFAGFDQRICEINSAGIVADLPINSGTAYWNVISGNGSVTDTSDYATLVNNLDYGSNLLTWTVNSFFGFCATSIDTVEIIRDESPGISDAGSDTAFCLATAFNLEGNAPLVGNGEWTVVSNPSGTAPVFTPNEFSPNAAFSILPGNEGIYQLEWMLENESCISRDTLTLDFGVIPPAANAGPDSFVCDTSHMLSANNFNIGTTFWQQLSGPSPLLFQPNINTADALISITTGNEGSYTLEWNIQSGTCPETRDTVIINFNAAPSTPITSDASSCGPDSLVLNATTSSPDDILQWYISSGDSVPVEIGNSFSTSLLLSDTTFYLRSIDTISGCISDPLAVNALIHTIPDKPILESDTLCGSGSGRLVGYINPPANDVYWFENMNDSVPIATGTVFITDSVLSTIFYYAQAVDNTTGCNSIIDSTQVFIWPEIPAPVAFNDSSCSSTDFTLRAFKSDINNLIFWHDSSIDGNIIAVNDSFNTVILDTTTPYWVSEFNPLTFCSSSRTEVRAIIHPKPDNPIISDTAHCGPSSFILVPGTDEITTSVQWFNTLIDENPFTVNDTLFTPILSSDKTYWLSGKNDSTGCESDRVSSTIDIHSLPTAVNISGPTLVLKGQTGLIFTTNGPINSTYDWNIPPEINVDQNLNDYVRLSFPETGIFNISVTETTVNGCEGITINHPIQVIDDSIAIDIGTESISSCTNQPFLIEPYLFGGSPPYYFYWSGDTSYLNTTNELYTEFYSPETGSFILYLQVIDRNDKTAYDTVSIQVFDAPTTTITTVDSIVCVGESLQLQSNSAGNGPFTFRWFGPVSYLDDYTTESPVYSPIASDTVQYELMITDVNGCSDNDSITLQSDIPIADFSVETDPGCSPLQMSFKNLSKQAVSFEWNFDDGETDTTKNIEHTFINASAEVKYFNVVLEAKSKLGCSDYKSNYISVWPNPVAELTALPNDVCSPANVILYSSPGNINYEFDFGNGESYTGGKISHVQNYINNSLEDKTYVAIVKTSTAFGCADSASTSIIVRATPSPDFTVSPESDTVPRNTFTLNNTTEGTFNYNWDFGNGTSSDQDEPGAITFEGAGNYTIQLKASNNYCSDSITKKALLYPALPVANFKSSGPGCMPHTVTLINNSQYADNYHWDFGDGSISNARSPSYTYYQAGKYRISLKVSGEGGESYFSDTLSVYQLPNSYFDIAPRYVYVNDEAVHYFNLSEHGDVFEWDFGDGSTSTDLNPKHVYSEEGNFDVTLKVWTSNDCFDLYVMENAVLVEPSGEIRYPNVIRPNSPIEENRIFLPGVLDNVDKYHLVIYNRWGGLIFESRDPSVGWDGTYLGKLVKQDAYVWKVTGTYSDGKAFEKTGDITLLY